MPQSCEQGDARCEQHSWKTRRKLHGANWAWSLTERQCTQASKSKLDMKHFEFCSLHYHAGPGLTYTLEHLHAPSAHTPEELLLPLTFAIITPSHSAIQTNPEVAMFVSASFFLTLSSWVQALLISGLMTHNSQLTKWPDSQKLGKLNRRGRYPSSEAIWTAGMAPRSASGRPSFQLGSFICLKRWNLSVRLVHLLVKLCQSFWCHFEGHANIK